MVALRRRVNSDDTLKPSFVLIYNVYFILFLALRRRILFLYGKRNRHYGLSIVIRYSPRLVARFAHVRTDRIMLFIGMSV